MDYHTKKQQLLRKAKAILIALLLIPLALLVFRPNNVGLGVVISLLSVATSLFLQRMGSRYLDSYSNFKKGEKSELVVKEALAKIPDIQVVNNFTIPEQSGDIDHLVICAGGVFVLDAKFRSGYLNAQGDRWWVRRRNGRIVNEYGHLNVIAKRHALGVRDYIQAEIGIALDFVRPVIVITSNFDSNYINTDVDVLSPEQLEEYFAYKNKVQKLEAAEMERIYSLFANLKQLT